MLTRIYFLTPENFLQRNISTTVLRKWRLQRAQCPPSCLWRWGDQMGFLLPELACCPTVGFPSIFLNSLEQGFSASAPRTRGGLATSTGGAQQHGCAQLLTKGAAPPTRDSPRWFQTSPDVPGGQKHPHLRTTELITDSLTTSSFILCSIFTKYAHKILNSLLLLQLRSGYGSFRSAEATALE